MRSARRLAAQYREERRFAALLVLWSGVLLIIFGWGAAFTSMGVPLLVIGACATILAAVLRPTPRFILACVAVLVVLGSGSVLWLVGAVLGPAR